VGTRLSTKGYRITSACVFHYFFFEAISMIKENFENQRKGREDAVNLISKEEDDSRLLPPSVRNGRQYSVSIA